MGLTGSRISVKKLAVRRNIDKFEPLVVEKKLTLKIFHSYNVLFCVSLG